jgi:hypothetical protein
MAATFIKKQIELFARPQIIHGDPGTLPRLDSLTRLTQQPLQFNPMALDQSVQMMSILTKVTQCLRSQVQVREYVPVSFCPILRSPWMQRFFSQ